MLDRVIHLYLHPLMKKLVSVKIALHTILFILCAVIIFHVLVVLEIIPSNIVWGGRIQSKQEMFVMESVSIALNLIMLLPCLIYGDIIKAKFNPTFIRICFWFMFVLFTLNTIGNIFAKNPLEAYVFTPITALLSLCCLVLAINSRNPRHF